MSKHKKEEVEEEEVAPFWMISFSDLMTLLLSFFIILFSISTIETKKMEELVESMGGRYLRGGSAHSGNKVIHGDPKQPPAKQPTITQEEQPSSEDSTSEPEKSSESVNAFAPSPVEITPHKPSQELETDHTIIPFQLNDPTLNDGYKKQLAKLAEHWLDSSDPITIKGHASHNETASRDIDDLAYERAWNVRDYLMTLGLARKRFTLVVAGANEPLDKELIVLSSRFGNTNTFVEIILETK